MADGADGADGNKVEEEREKLRKRVSVLCSRRSQRDGRLKPNFLFFSSLLLTKIKKNRSQIARRVDIVASPSTEEAGGGSLIFGFPRKTSKFTWEATNSR